MFGHIHSKITDSLIALVIDFYLTLENQPIQEISKIKEYSFLISWKYFWLKLKPRIFLDMQFKLDVTRPLSTFILDYFQTKQRI